MNDDLRLIVNDKEYGGWETVSFRRSLKNLCGDFSVSASDVWTVGGVPWKINEQDAVVLYIGNDKIFTGWVDAVESETGDRSFFTVEGRDKTADLVDCSNQLQISDLNKLSIKQIFEKLISDYNLSAVWDFTPDPKRVKFTEEQVLTPGDSVFEAMKIFVAEDGFLLNTDADGNLFITREAETVAEVGLKLGMNIKKISCRYDTTNRFSKYIVKGQPQDSEGGGWEKKSFEGVEGLAVDTGVSRNRNLIIHASKKMTKQQCNDMAAWERNTRRAAGLMVNVEVQGWRQRPGGKLWALNQLVNVQAKGHGLENDNMNLLVGDVSYMKNSSGTTCNFGLVPKGSFTLKPLKPKAGRAEPLRWKSSTDGKK